MKTFLRLLLVALMALLVLRIEAAETNGPQFPGSGTALRSPSAKYEVYCVDADSSADAKHLGDNHALFLRKVGSGAGTKVITFGRHVAVTWAPSGEVFFVNDHYGSGQVRCRVFACGSGELRELSHRFLSVDCKAVAWVSDSALKLVVRDSAGEREETVELNNAEGSFPVQELRFETIFATRPNDSAAYIVLGSGYLRALSAGNEKEFIKHWLEIHPHATATPISTCNPMRADRPPARHVYVWIEDGPESLNVSLIEEGVFSGGVMLDMVESQQRMMEGMHDPKLTAVRKELEAELAAQPEADRVKRLISDTDYAARRKRIEAAELKARDTKKGIWSDAMKEEREAEGIE